MAALMTEEHRTIREVAAELLPLVQVVAAGGSDDSGTACA